MSINIYGKSVEGKPVRLRLYQSVNHLLQQQDQLKDDTNQREMIQRWLIEQQPAELYLTDSKISSSLIQQTIESSFLNTNLRVLNFRASQFNKDNLQLLIQLLKRNRSIESIDLFHCQEIFSSSSAGLVEENNNNNNSPSVEQLMDELLQLFADSKYLRSVCGCTVAKPVLSLHKTSSLTTAEMEFIYADLRKNTDLKFLCISCTHSIEYIFLALLNYNRTLHQLLLFDIEEFDLSRLPSSALTNKGGAQRGGGGGGTGGNGLKNSTLKTLQLKFNPHINNKSISDCLSWLSGEFFPSLSITTLQLDYLPVEDFAIQFLCDVLKTHKTLLHLSLFNIHWNWINWKKFTSFISDNKSLRVLHLDANNEVDHRSRQVLGKALENRHTPLILR
jgi:hypothetical protein